MRHECVGADKTRLTDECNDEIAIVEAFRRIQGVISWEWGKDRNSTAVRIRLSFLHRLIKGHEVPAS